MHAFRSLVVPEGGVFADVANVLETTTLRFWYLLMVGILT
jgi:hypothetical protein